MYRVDCLIQWTLSSATYCKDSSFYNALVCPPPSASVSKDTIGAIQMLF